MQIIEQVRLKKSDKIRNYEVTAAPNPQGELLNRHNRRGNISVIVSLEENTGDIVVATQRPDLLNPDVTSVEKKFIPRGSEFSVTVPELRRRIIVIN
ncbi:MAG: hypothetical protein NTY75_04570 [Candidatus Shapirobacteria bacterium]|nr:hypothetical protein [Candidatus Shapirobacteria bacterium]